MPLTIKADVLFHMLILTRVGIKLINAVLVWQLTLGKGQIPLEVVPLLLNRLTHNDALDVPELLTGQHRENAKLETIWHIWVRPSPAPLKQTGEKAENLQPQTHIVNTTCQKRQIRVFLKMSEMLSSAHKIALGFDATVSTWLRCILGKPESSAHMSHLPAAVPTNARWATYKSMPAAI